MNFRVGSPRMGNPGDPMTRKAEKLEVKSYNLSNALLSDSGNWDLRDRSDGTVIVSIALKRDRFP
jgi:hypothetical protein